MMTERQSGLVVGLWLLLALVVEPLVEWLL